MTQILKQIEREIEKSRNIFNKSCRVMESFSDLKLSELTEKQKNQFSEAAKSYEKQDKILTALYSAKKSIEQIN